MTALPLAEIQRQVFILQLEFASAKLLSAANAYRSGLDAEGARRMTEALEELTIKVPKGDKADA